MKKKESIIKNSTILDDESSYNTKRIENIVKASDLLRNIDYSKDNSKDKNSRKGLLKKVFYPYYQQYPETVDYASKGSIVDIQFDDEFENALLNKNIVDLDKENNLPEYIIVTINPENNDDSFSYKLNVNNEEFNKFIDNYGNGHLDNLIGKSVILKPSESRYKKYNISIPKNTATSKLKSLYTKLYSDNFNRTTETSIKDFVFKNSIRSLIIYIQLFILYLNYQVLISDIPQDMTTDDYLGGLLFTYIISGMFMIMLYTLSANIYDDYNGGNKYIGAFEYGIYMYIRDGFINAYEYINNFNKKLGENIDITK